MPVLGPLWRGNHVTTKELVENFARYIYLPRLKHKDILIEAMRDGVQSSSWRTDTFAYASGWNEERQRYVNLQVGHAVHVVVDGQSLLVKSGVAEAQMMAEAAELEAKLRTSNPPTGAVTERESSEQTPLESAGRKNVVQEGAAGLLSQQQLSITVTNQEEKKQHRFYGSVQINERMIASDAGKIMEEVVKHLTSLSDAKVKVTLEITADLPDGAPEHVVRTIKENSNTLRFQAAEFHEE